MRVTVADTSPKQKEMRDSKHEENRLKGRTIKNEREWWSRNGWDAKNLKYIDQRGEFVACASTSSRCTTHRNWIPSEWDPEGWRGLAKRGLRRRRGKEGGGRKG